MQKLELYARRRYFLVAVLASLIACSADDESSPRPDAEVSSDDALSKTPDAGDAPSYGSGEDCETIHFSEECSAPEDCAEGMTCVDLGYTMPTFQMRCADGMSSGSADARPVHGCVEE